MRYSNSSLDSAGFTWYCQEAQSRWATDPAVGWEIFFDESQKPPTWMLYGFGVEYNTGVGKGCFKSALREAGRWIQEDYDNSLQETRK